MVLEGGSLVKLVLREELDVLAELNREDTTAFLFKGDWIGRDHSNLRLLRLTTLNWLLFRLLVLLGRVRILVVCSLVHHSQSEFDLFWLNIRLALEAELARTVLCLFFLGEHGVFLGSFGIFLGFRIDHFLFKLG